MRGSSIRLHLGSFLLVGLFCVACVGDPAERFFDSDGVSLRYIDRGEGEPVVLIHGFTNNLERGWAERRIVDALVTAGYRVIAYDNRGHGKSDKPHEAGTYGMHMVADLGRMLDHLELERAHIVGYSMGAAISSKFAAQHPERVSSVVLAGYGNLVLPPVYTEELEAELEATLGSRNLLDGNDPRALTMLSTQWSEWHVEPEVLRQNTVPALALIGDADPFLPQTESMIEAMSGIELKIVPGTHSTAPDTLEFLEELLTFLSLQAG